MITDFDDAYSNMAYIPGGAEYPARWAAQAERFRETLPGGCTARLDLSYGADPRQTFDLFAPKNAKGLCIFVHGGYWMKFSKTDWSHLAGGALARGWAVALPGYRLTPDTSISGITSDIAKAITAISKQVDGPMNLAGHSAGGHLVTRMICEPSQLQPDILDRIAQVISISGVHDLRPLLQTHLNDTLKLSELEARNESPALRRPRAGSKVICWVGANERPEFVRQNDLLANVWHGLGADMQCQHEAKRHHFDVVDGLMDPDHPLTQLFAPL